MFHRLNDKGDNSLTEMISISDDVFHAYTTCGAGTGGPSGAPEFSAGFSRVRFPRFFVLCVVFSTSFLPSIFFLFVIVLSLL
jgi:hypothetical protein